MINICREDSGKGLDMKKLEVGTQGIHVISDEAPLEGFQMLKQAGFSGCDFGLNSYLQNDTLYQFVHNDFFNKTDRELEELFAPHKKASELTGVRISQMHMPYPICVPKAPQEFNAYLQNVVAPQSLKICAYLDCPYIVVHGFKLARELGSEEAEWERTEAFLHTLAPMARERGITLCIENIYTDVGKHIVEGPCCNARKAAMRIDQMNDRYGAEVLGFCFDTGHANLVGIDFEDFLTILGHRVKVLHIHDNDGISDLHQIPFTFSRDRGNRASTDWAGFIRGLANIQFGGILSFETAPALVAFPTEMKCHTLKFIANVGQYFADKIYDLS